MSHDHPRTIAEMEHTPPGERPERKQYDHIDVPILGPALQDQSTGCYR